MYQRWREEEKTRRSTCTAQVVLWASSSLPRSSQVTRGIDFLERTTFSLAVLAPAPMARRRGRGPPPHPHAAVLGANAPAAPGVTNPSKVFSYSRYRPPRGVEPSKQPRPARSDKGACLIGGDRRHRERSGCRVAVWSAACLRHWYLQFSREAAGVTGGARP